METVYRRTADSLRFQPPRIPHAAAVMVMALTFHTEDPEGVGYALNIFLFHDLSPSVGLEAGLLMQKWYAILGGGTLTSFKNTSLMVVKQKVAPISFWDEAATQL